jgi:hypothetical protein
MLGTLCKSFATCQLQGWVVQTFWQLCCPLAGWMMMLKKRAQTSMLVMEAG